MSHFLMEMFLAPLPMVYIFLSLFILQECVLMLMTSTTECILIAMLLKQGYRYRKIRTAFSTFYHIHSELIVKYTIWLKSRLQQGISEPIFYGDLVNKYKRIVGKPNLCDQFQKIIKHYIKIGCNLDVMRWSTCLV